MLVGRGATLVQIGLRLGALFATLSHAIDVSLLNPKEHLCLTLGRVKARRRVDCQLLDARLLALVANLLDIGLGFIDLCRVGIGIGVEILGPLDDHVNRGIRRRRSGILAHVKLIVRSRGGTESVDRRV